MTVTLSEAYFILWRREQSTLLGDIDVICLQMLQSVQSSAVCGSPTVVETIGEAGVLHQFKSERQEKERQQQFVQQAEQASEVLQSVLNSKAEQVVHFIRTLGIYQNSTLDFEIPGWTSTYQSTLLDGAEGQKRRLKNVGRLIAQQHWVGLSLSEQDLVSEPTLIQMVREEVLSLLTPIEDYLWNVYEATHHEK